MRTKVVFAVIFLSSLLSAQSGLRLRVRNPSELYAEQRRILGTWCRQDFEGLRLADAAWDRFKPITALKENPDVSSIVIVSRYQVDQPATPTWSLEVTYTVLGRYEHGTGYRPDSGTETVTFKTKDIDGDIFITDLEPNSPHVSKKAIIEWMKKRLTTPLSDVEKIHITDALKALEPDAGAATATQPAK